MMPANDQAPIYPELVIPELTDEQNQAWWNLVHGKHPPGLTKRRLERLAPTALWIAGNHYGEQPRYIGDNRGGWPILFGPTQKWAWDRREKLKHVGREPYFPRGLIARYWFNTWEEMDLVQCALWQSMRDHFEEALDGFLSFDPDLGLPAIDRKIRSLADAVRAECRSDAEWLRFLDMQIACARAYPQRSA